MFLLASLFLIDLGSILSNTGWVARGVLALLLLFSIISWAMILQKLGTFGTLRRQSDQFLRIFRATRGVVNPQALAAAGSPFASLYPAGYRELQSQVVGAPTNPHPPQPKSFQTPTANIQTASPHQA